MNSPALRAMRMASALSAGERLASISSHLIVALIVLQGYVFMRKDMSGVCCVAHFCICGMLWMNLRALMAHSS